jgi:preprotein translocase subunit YajC
VNNWILLAVGQSDGGAPQGPAGGFIGGLLPMIIIFAVFYFLIIRPQSKRQREHRQMLDQLKKGDRVVTNGGLIGSVWALDDKIVTLEIADKVKVKVLRAQVAGTIRDAEGGPAPEQQKE